MAQQTATTYGAGRSEAIYLTQEASYGVAVDHAGTDAVPTDSEAQLTVEFPRNPNLDKKETLSLHEVYDDGMYKTNFSLPDTDFKPSGSAAAAPDMAVAFKTLMGNQLNGTASTTTVAASPAPTTTVFTVASATDIAVGKPIRFAGDVTTALASKCRMVVALDGAAVTVAPALSVAPGTGDTITIGFGWPQTTVNELSMSAFQEFVLLVQAATGISLNTGKFTIAGNGHVKFGCSGVGCGKYSFVGQAVTTGTTAVDALTMAVATGQGKRFRVTSDDPPLYIRVEDEIIKVTAVSGDNLTIVRAQKSSSAAEHATASVIVPWRPTRTLVGSPIFTTSKLSETLLDGAAFRINQATVDIDNGFAEREPCVGDQWTAEAPHRNGMNPFKCNLALSGRLTKDNLHIFGGAMSATTHTFFAAVGSAAFKFFVIYIPKWKPNIKNPQGAEDEMMFDHEGECMETSGLDVVYFGQV